MIYELKQSGIDAAVGAYEEFCQSLDMPGKQAMMLSMSMDSMLTKLSAHYGEDFTFSFSTGTRFKKPFAKILWEGERYNPVENDESEDVEAGSQMAFFSTVYQSLDVAPHYTYRSGINIIQMPFKRKEMNAMLLLLLAIVAGMVFGILTQNLPADALDVINKFADYVNSFIFGLISMVAAPMIFLSIEGGIVGVGSVHEVGKLGGKTLSKQVIYTLIGCIAVFFLSLKLFPVTIGEVAGGASVADNIMGSIFGLFPVNIVGPFLNGNYSQIIGIAVILGVAVLLMGEKAAAFNEICGILSYAVSTAMGWFVKLIPIAIFFMFAQYVWAGTVSELLQAWKIFAVCILCSVVGYIIYLLMTAHKNKIPVKELFALDTKALIIGLSTGSSSAAFYEINEVCKNKLHLRRTVIDFSVPLGITMFCPGNAYSFISPVIYCVSIHGDKIDISQLVLLIILSAVFSMAVPPVAGGVAACVPIIISSLALPTEYVAICTSVAILFDYIATAEKCGAVIFVAANVSNEMDDTLLHARKFGKKSENA